MREGNRSPIRPEGGRTHRTPNEILCDDGHRAGKKRPKVTDGPGRQGSIVEATSPRPRGGGPGRTRRPGFPLVPCLSLVESFCSPHPIGPIDRKALPFDRVGPTVSHLVQANLVRFPDRTPTTTRTNVEAKHRRGSIMASAAAAAGGGGVPTVGRPSPEDAGQGIWAYLDGSRMFFAGGAAGATARTCTAPLDRIKLLFQVQAVQSAGVGSTAYTGVWQSVVKIWKEEGAMAYWKGNGTNIIRIFPYSAAQLMANDQYKRILADDSGNLSVAKRLAAGACAGMTATTLTHPLDTVRLRLALPNTPYQGMMNAVVTISSKEGLLALYKGLAPTLVGIAPYAALNFSSYDLLKTWAYSNGNIKQSPMTNIGIGAMAGTLASTVCYPLDTVRRRMQMPGQTYMGQSDALVQIFQKEGFRGFFRGWAANTLKVVPQNSIRFVTYEFLKSMLGVKRAKTDT